MRLMSIALFVSLLGMVCAIISVQKVLKIEAIANERPNISNKPTRQPTAVPTITPRPTEAVHAIPTLPDTQDSIVTGRASFYTNDYCRKYNPACHTASGEVFDDTKFTAACASRYPLGSTLRVTYQNVVVEVKCNDRGSFEGSYNRLLDLSKASFEALAPLSRGIITVQVELLK